MLEIMWHASFRPKFRRNERQHRDNDSQEPSGKSGSFQENKSHPIITT
jgi:hypothetical protein